MKASRVRGVLKKFNRPSSSFGGFVPPSLELCLGNYGYNPDDKGIVTTAAFMKRCLTTDPDARASALELLGDGWLPMASGCVNRTNQI